LENVLALVRERIPRRFGLDPVRDVQVLCPMNRGGLGARSPPPIQAEGVAAQA